MGGFFLCILSRVRRWTDITLAIWEEGDTVFLVDLNVTKGTRSGVAGKRSFGTQRKTMTGLNVVVFTGGDLRPEYTIIVYIPRYVDTREHENNRITQ